MDKQLFDNILQLRLSIKQMERLSKKADKEQTKEEAKIKSALQKGNVDIARVYGENAVRKRNESINYLRMASKLDGVRSRLEMTQATHSISKHMKSVVKALDSAISTMDLEKISSVMNKFETQFENLDVHSSVLEDSMSNSVTTQVPESQVQSLMKQIADEAGLEISEQLSGVSVPSSTALPQTSATKDDALSTRLAALRQ